MNYGRINLVTDEPLRAMLLNWPGLVEDMVEGEVDQKDFQVEIYAPFIIEYLSLNRVYNKFASKSFRGGPFDVYRRETRLIPN